MKNKQVALASLLSIAVLTNGSAQSPEKERQEKILEVGSTIRVPLDFYDDFGKGLSLSIGKNKSAWNLSGLFFGSAHTSGAIVKARREYRRKLGNKFEFKFGPGISYSETNRHYHSRFELLEYQNSNHSHFRHHEFGLDFVTGVNYPISNRVIVGVETRHSMIYSRNRHTETEYDGKSLKTIKNEFYETYDLANTELLVNASYRF